MYIQTLIYDKRYCRAVRKKWSWQVHGTESDVDTGGNFDPYLIPCTKTNSRWIINLSMNDEAIKLVHRNIGTIPL